MPSNGNLQGAGAGFPPPPTPENIQLLATDGSSLILRGRRSSSDSTTPLRPTTRQPPRGDNGELRYPGPPLPPRQDENGCRGNGANGIATSVPSRLRSTDAGQAVAGGSRRTSHLEPPMLDRMPRTQLQQQQHHPGSLQQQQPQQQPLQQPQQQPQQQQQPQPQQQQQLQQQQQPRHEDYQWRQQQPQQPPHQIPLSANISTPCSCHAFTWASPQAFSDTNETSSDTDRHSAPRPHAIFCHPARYFFLASFFSSALPCPALSFPALPCPSSLARVAL